MKKIIIITTILLATVCAKSFACLNYYVLDSSGHKQMHEHSPPSNIYVYSKYTIEELKRLEKQIVTAGEPDKFKYISNYAASLIRLGRSNDAIPILESLLKKKPNEYEIMANLAVAYELNGRIDEALVFLKRSLKINPKSHHGSEWFHLRFLEAAIKLRDNNLQPDAISVLKIEKESTKDIGPQLSYQLNERIPLTKSPNSLLSKVIEESGDYYRANISLEWSIELYAIAIAYTSDKNTENRLWQKMNACREKLMKFKRQGKQGTVCEYLYTAKWKNNIYEQIHQWRKYQPTYYTKPIIKTF